MASRVALSVLSLLPVVCGARRAARRDQVKQAACAVEEPAHGWLAARAPLCSGVALLALHFLYRMCPHDVLSEMLAVYSLVLGTVALLYSIRPTALAMLPEGFPNTWYQVTLNQGLGTARREIWSMRFDRRDLLSLAASLSVGLCYFVTKHWAAGDVLAVSLALRGVELLPLCSIPAACLLFACLCLHDITWLKGIVKRGETEQPLHKIMLKCQELSGLEGNIPIALVFPKALFGDGVDVSPFVVVPLDTVVIPGIFIAFLLKFDISIERNSRVYFYTGLTSYAAGLCLTAVLEQYALPMFPYLAPVYLGLPLLVAAYRAELTEMFCFVSAVERSPHTPQASELPLMPGYPAALGAFMSCKPRLYHIADPSSV
ncbi:minor histocompatibility antigen H13-like isoform X2 [Lethenteron reissneri]|uniref:minor histocompatibility antigen H13-like isoform X2 n=1 Tax=Lethenteron reissneri TaxID=7753 RepID=UPI002AB78D9E|nr:minor histocompatibility antigen H13-like isoform X2 [Lethenteron reissneri]